MQAGADDSLGKPFDQLELKARLLVGETKPTGAYMRRSKMAGIVWSTSTTCGPMGRGAIEKGRCYNLLRQIESRTAPTFGIPDSDREASIG